ncbi:MAG: stringent starvation protein B [Arenicella sp.]|jgi:stringent starvation protein B|tara:strand:- start:8039 stop:8461 length:423 start_codon:yes stop_codon:yes gene_type:complete
MSPNRPYLLRAFFDWIVDNDCTPHIIVDAHHPMVAVPQEFVKDGQIVLNIAPRAVTNLSLDGDDVQFSARFNGMPVDIYVPIAGVLGIYAQENGQGMVFDQEDSPEPPPSATPPSAPKMVRSSEAKDKSIKPKPSLRVVK